MECLGGGVNRIECEGVVGVDGLSEGDIVGLELSLVKSGLGDCVWCVLLPKLVANATLLSKNRPRVSQN